MDWGEGSFFGLGAIGRSLCLAVVVVAVFAAFRGGAGTLEPDSDRGWRRLLVRASSSHPEKEASPPPHFVVPGLSSDNPFTADPVGDVGRHECVPFSDNTRRLVPQSDGPARLESGSLSRGTLRREASLAEGKFAKRDSRSVTPPQIGRVTFPERSST